ncbi:MULTISPECIES: hypothetical protein [Haloferax]|uniref:hypothetical protein n=1 Tax=Haloferax TaxID=2251 RepID=UPI0012DCE6AD|nr:hypothetical protein [Haloferax mediterranei]MDX5989640.1 hypothetical protein [Haloferax mediterranei ATCC 33500]
MSEAPTCETHAWASVGVVIRDGTVYRVWECENCPVWTLEPFDPDYERDWDDTWLAER